MDNSFSKFNSKMQLALAAFGRTGATAYPFKEQDPLDKVLFEFFVDKTMLAYSKTRVKRTLQDILTKDLSSERQNKLLRMLSDARRQKVKQEANIVVAPNFTFHAAINKPAFSLKRERVIEFLSKQGWPLKKIEAFIDECSEYAEPAQTFTSVPSSS